ncbi:MAG: hypothetical protein IJ861_05095 [Clostridia bacterium]|nr:hypothetical protein [Clostridia bacterium]
MSKYEIEELKVQFANYMSRCSVSDDDKTMGAAARYITDFLKYLEAMSEEEPSK